MGGRASGTLHRHPARHRSTTLSARSAAFAARGSRSCASGMASSSASTLPRRSMSPNTRRMSATRSRPISRPMSMPRCGSAPNGSSCMPGFHFTSDKPQRMQAGRERLKRVVAHAENKGALVLLENLNKEPDDAEVHYLAHTIEEWRYYFDDIHSLGVQAVVHRQPRASGARRHSGLHRCDRALRGSRRCGSPIASATASRST